MSQGLAGAIDVGLAAPRQSADDRAGHAAGDFSHRLEIAGRRDREAGFDHIDAQLDQRPGELQLFGQIHAGAGDCSPSRSVVSKITMCRGVTLVMRLISLNRLSL